MDEIIVSVIIDMHACTGCVHLSNRITALESRNIEYDGIMSNVPARDFVRQKSIRLPISSLTRMLPSDESYRCTWPAMLDAVKFG